MTDFKRGDSVLITTETRARLRLGRIIEKDNFAPTRKSPIFKVAIIKEPFVTDEGKFLGVRRVLGKNLEKITNLEKRVYEMEIDEEI